MDGSEAPPVEFADQQTKAAYRARHCKKFSAIALSVSSDLLYLITDTEAPNVVWQRLQDHFERNTLANKLFLKKQYFTFLQILQFFKIYFDMSE